MNCFSITHPHKAIFVIHFTLQYLTSTLKISQKTFFVSWHLFRLWITYEENIKYSLIVYLEPQKTKYFQNPLNCTIHLMFLIQESNQLTYSTALIVTLAFGPLLATTCWCICSAAKRKATSYFNSGANLSCKLMKFKFDWFLLIPY